MAYPDDITALNPNHYWQLDGSFADSAGGLAGTAVGGFSTSAPAICQDASSSARCSGVAHALVIPDTSGITGSTERKLVAGWVKLNSIQLPPKSIYREGEGGNQFNIVCWAGNNVMLDVVNLTSGTVAQAFGDRVLQPGRVYHIAARILCTGFGDRIELFIDGVLQSKTLPADGTLNYASLPGRPGVAFGDPQGGTEVGNGTVTLNGPENCDYQNWAFWTSRVEAEMSATTIREELFEKGVLSDLLVGSQNGLDAIVGTERADAPCCIRVHDDVIGSGDATFVADAVTFSPLASIHIQWMGVGTLTWVNTNGSNASIVSTPNGGTVNIVNPATITVEGLVSNSEVRVFEAGTVNELSGIESSSTAFSASVQAAAIDIRIMSLGYQNKVIRNVDMSNGDVTALAGQVVDRQYGNV